MSTNDTHERAEQRALRAAEAGVVLASLIGLAEPISEQRMWRMGRLRQVPNVRLGRMMFFRRDQLLSFVESGGRCEP